ncbi:MAG: hypothetical protein R3C61_27840 [Bacteroidia bacterium]
MDLILLFNTQFANAWRYQNVSNYLKLGGFGINLVLIGVSLFNPELLESPIAIVVILISSVAILFFDFDFMNKSKSEHEKGERVRKIHLVDFLFNSKIEAVEIDYIMLDLDSWVEKEIEKFKDKNATPKNGNATPKIDSTTNFLSEETEKIPKIISNIQQNCFETSHYLTQYHKELNKKLKLRIIILSIAIMLLWVLLITNDFSRFSSTQLFIIAFNLIFATNIFSYIKRFEEKSDKLKDLDKTLEKIKNSAEMSDVIYYFSEYNSILTDKPLYPSRIYENNSKGVDEKWTEREKKSQAKKSQTAEHKSSKPE